MQINKRRQWRNPDGTIVSVWIERGAKVSRRARLGEGAKIAAGAEVRAASWVGRNACIERGAIVSNGAVVEDEALIGRGALVLAGAYVGNGAICGDGSTVLCRGIVLQGNPLQRGATRPASGPDETWLLSDGDRPSAAVADDTMEGDLK
jgi:carbonic anhydrase/acetyltransferase-like protein (isoleucine patch superfamily)